MSQDINDYINPSILSDCCQAPVINDDFCSECGERCEVINEDEEEVEIADPFK